MTEKLVSPPEVMLRSPDVATVSFDLWLTLLSYPDTTFRDCRNKLVQDILAPEMSPEEFTATLHTQDKIADNLAEDRESDVTFNERINRLAAALGKPEPTHEELIYLYSEQGKLLEEHPPVLIEPELPDYLDELGENHGLAVISNTGFLHGDQMRKALGQLGIRDMFSAIIFSNEVGKAKPHPAIFQELTSLSNQSPEKIVHIGDNRKADYQGALAAGMSAIHIPRRSGVITVLRETLQQEH